MRSFVFQTYWFDLIHLEYKIPTREHDDLSRLNAITGSIDQQESLSIDEQVFINEIIQQIQHNIDENDYSSAISDFRHLLQFSNTEPDSFNRVFTYAIQHNFLASIVPLISQAQLYETISEILQLSAKLVQLPICTSFFQNNVVIFINIVNNPCLILPDQPDSQFTIDIALQSITVLYNLFRASAPPPEIGFMTASVCSGLRYAHSIFISFVILLIELGFSTPDFVFTLTAIALVDVDLLPLCVRGLVLLPSHSSVFAIFRKYSGYNDPPVQSALIRLFSHNACDSLYSYYDQQLFSGFAASASTDVQVDFATLIFKLVENGLVQYIEAHHLFALVVPLIPTIAYEAGEIYVLAICSAIDELSSESLIELLDLAFVEHLARYIESFEGEELQLALSAAETLATFAVANNRTSEQFETLLNIIQAIDDIDDEIAAIIGDIQEALESPQ